MENQERPLSVKDLRKGINAYSTTSNFSFPRVQKEFTYAIVCQMLPASAVIKGGASLALQFPLFSTRLTSDLDIVIKGSLESFQNEFSKTLNNGWEGFTGELAIRLPLPKNSHMPQGYSMTPMNVKLSYFGKPFATVEMDITPQLSNELDWSHLAASPSNRTIFESLGFPIPQVGNAISFEQQIAQKIQGLANPDVARPEDLVDIQLILKHEKELDSKLFGNSLIREFEINKRTIPLDISTITVLNKSEYALIKDQFPDLRDFDEALAMVEELTTPFFSSKYGK